MIRRSRRARKGAAAFFKSQRIFICEKRAVGLGQEIGPESEPRYFFSALALNSRNMSLIYGAVIAREMGCFAELPNPPTWSVETRPM